MKRKPSAKLFKLALRAVRAARANERAYNEFCNLAEKEFPEFDPENDAVAENIAYGSWLHPSREHLRRMIEEGKY